MKTKTMSKKEERGPQKSMTQKINRKKRRLTTSSLTKRRVTTTRSNISTMAAIITTKAEVMMAMAMMILIEFQPEIPGRIHVFIARSLVDYSRVFRWRILHCRPSTDLPFEIIEL